MSNNITHAAFLLPLTTVQTAFAIDVCKHLASDRSNTTNDEASEPATNLSDVYCIAKRITTLIPGHQEGGLLLGFEYHAADGGLEIFYDDHINTENAAVFCQQILLHFNSEKYVTINASHIGENFEYNDYGGHAAFVTKDIIVWMSTTSWLEEQIKKLKPS
jgi:hypothetical protein